MRLGVFGGSFDPVHFGHLELAESCLRNARLDEVWFVPTASQPLKPDGPRATAEHRLAMLELALVDRDSLSVSKLEIDRGGISYTVDTLRQICRELPTARLFLLLGADALDDLPNWREPGEICRLAIPLVVNRAEAQPVSLDALKHLVSAERVEEIKKHKVEMHDVAISSSMIRQHIAQGLDWEDLVPRQVASYIRDNRLYSVSPEQI